ncbi:hypothetical protein CEXT_470981 [Caerostris extrusa]|uniref:Uncharacterized protein n=1 Tax=Caerostris extrusa TaxID=172846 RepID=A0AAV4PAK9_CAEEX|nr:hypothetical protein CEXT_470981 [Caerostris extrusa]
MSITGLSAASDGNEVSNSKALEDINKDALIRCFQPLSCATMSVSRPCGKGGGAVGDLARAGTEALSAVYPVGAGEAARLSSTFCCGSPGRTLPGCSGGLPMPSTARKA